MECFSPEGFLALKDAILSIWPQVARYKLDDFCLKFWCQALKNGFSVTLNWTFSPGGGPPYTTLRFLFERKS